MKPNTDAHHDYDDGDMTIEQIVERMRWLDAMLTDLQREMAAAVNPDDPRSSAISRNQ
jgi:hypothetical protein